MHTKPPRDHRPADLVRDEPRVPAGTVAQDHGWKGTGAIWNEKDSRQLVSNAVDGAAKRPRGTRRLPGVAGNYERARIRDGRGTSRRRCAPTVRLRGRSALQDSECGRDEERKPERQRQFPVYPRGRTPSSASSSRTAAS